ncbi:Hypp9009 [Branchiostoma lanceolatum]|uniref:Hypp9009 protein n=1 Tax=Branchiostoma lanceolatum TaxID=7740 RepID=A0A8J9ZAW0_BRALA|nr:Hypp9009 [Branchiostoma lanceolatum]
MIRRLSLTCSGRVQLQTAQLFCIAVTTSPTVTMKTFYCLTLLLAVIVTSYALPMADYHYEEEGAVLAVGAQPSPPTALYLANRSQVPNSTPENAKDTTSSQKPGIEPKISSSLA